MATVYKVEIEMVSDWVNYPPETLQEVLKELIESNTDADNSHNEVTVSKIKVERKA